MEYNLDNFDYYWEDDVMYVNVSDDFTENPYIGPGDYDEDEDYPFDEDQYENFLDMDNQ